MSEPTRPGTPSLFEAELAAQVQRARLDLDRAVLDGDAAAAEAAAGRIADLDELRDRHAAVRV